MKKAYICSMFSRNLLLQNLAKDRFGSVEFSTFGRLYAKPKVAGGGGGKSGKLFEVFPFRIIHDFAQKVKLN